MEAFLSVEVVTNLITGDVWEHIPSKCTFHFNGVFAPLGGKECDFVAPVSGYSLWLKENFRIDSSGL